MNVGDNVCLSRSGQPTIVKLPFAASPLGQ